MNWPIEYEDRNRVNGFAVFDEEFDFMLVDRCCDPSEKPDLDKIRRLLGSNRTSCLDPAARLFPA
jgi:hypothetical protein